MDTPRRYVRYSFELIDIIAQHGTATPLARPNLAPARRALPVWARPRHRPHLAKCKQTLVVSLQTPPAQIIARRPRIEPRPGRSEAKELREVGLAEPPRGAPRGVLSGARVVAEDERGDLALLLLQLHDAVLHRARHRQAKHTHLPALADAVDAVARLPVGASSGWWRSRQRKA